MDAQVPRLQAEKERLRMAVERALARYDDARAQGIVSFLRHADEVADEMAQLLREALAIKEH